MIINQFYLHINLYIVYISERKRKIILKESKHNKLVSNDIY